MGKIDGVTNKYMRKNAYFADAFNFYVFHGQQVIDPNGLRDMDPLEIISLPGDNGTSLKIEKQRDVLRLVNVKSDDHATYILLGLENQSNVHYGMPVRNMLYDALSYARQIDEIAQRHKNEKEYGKNSGEFLSGIHKKDRLYPVMTLVIYWSPDEWDGPRSIHEMLDDELPEIKDMVADYRIHVVAPAEIMHVDFARFKTELGKTLKFVKYSDDKEKLSEYILNDKEFERLSNESVELINTVTNIGIEINQGSEVSNVCKGMQDLIADGKVETKIETRAEMIVGTVDHMVCVGNMSVTDACKLAGFSEEEYYSSKRMLTRKR